MTERIEKLVGMTLAGKMWVEPVQVEYDRTDLFLPPVAMSAKRVCEYIAAQDLNIPEQACFTGLLRFDGSVEGDLFNRMGHKNFQAAYEAFYNKPVDDLVTFEWQHAVGDFGSIIRRGIGAVKDDIERSKAAHEGDREAQLFLDAQAAICDALITRAHKGAKKARAVAETTAVPEYRDNLLRLSDALKRIPEAPAANFYEAVLCLYFCYAYLPDSIGLIDRYLYPYYRQDVESGELPRERAKEYLQELFLMLQARISVTSDRFTRGGESHFCVGGTLENGEDGWNDLSQLIVESLMELPTYIPQISLRWTKNTPRSVLRFLLDCERRDPNKRIAFVNDEPRLKGLVEHTGLPFEEAVNYTMIGCNELALPGGMVRGFDPVNLVRSVEHTFRNRRSDLEKAKTYEEFYAIFREELFCDLDEAENICRGFEDVRSRDCNLVSCLFLKGCVENAKSATQSGLSRSLAVGDLIGIPNVIDSLSVVKQFVYDEKRVTIGTLSDALEKNWQGFEDLRTQILKKGRFFGNNDALPDEIARRLLADVGVWNEKENYMGKKRLFGNLVGYNEHQKFFGSATGATPDGRFSGDPIAFGIGQTQGKDRKGLTALLASVATCDPGAVLTGPSVTNVLLDEQLVRNDASFEKLVSLFETYFRLGGTHFQLTYVSKEDLAAARKTPGAYKNLRVRVSGFSDYYVLLNDALQEEILERTAHRG